ncbi:MAG: hypothetical protein IJ545_02005 [Alphaproteobacteria bacterium]|nr:hypothetical protein [Alphaproteobacteria bacterium]
MKITIDEIKENLVFAAKIMRRLPPVKVQGYFCSWPKFCADEDDIHSSNEVWLMPLPEEIEKMEEILDWLKFIEMEQRRIVWLRSCGMGWKQISARTHRGRSSLIRDFNASLKTILDALVCL